MKKLYYFKTNAYDMLVSVDEENNVRCMTENNYCEFPHYDSFMETEEEYKERVIQFLETVEDDSSWKEYIHEEFFYDEFFNDVETIAEIETENL